MQLGVFKWLMLTPVTIQSFIIGAAVSQIMMGVIQGILIVACGALMIKMTFIFNCRINAGRVYSCIFCLHCVWFRYCISHTKTRSCKLLFLMIFLTIFFLGCFPEESLPDIIQKIIPWLPTKMAIELKRGVVNVFKIRDSWIYWAYTRIGL
jgi:hypothetical protein